MCITPIAYSGENIFFLQKIKLVGGFNPSEKYWSNWIISPGRDEHKKNI